MAILFFSFKPPSTETHDRRPDSVPGASWLRHAMAYSRLASSSSKVLARIRAQTFRSGIYIVFVSGL